jgi:hypothetical protein
MKIMKTLAQSNPYLRDGETRRRWLEENARESCVFEGARILKPRNGRRYSRRRSIASAKNSAKAS